MTKRVPGSERTREALNDLIDGRLRVDDGKSELVRLATRLIIEEGLEAEMRDALGRVSYAAPQVSGTPEPFRSELRGHLKGHGRSGG